MTRPQSAALLLATGLAAGCTGQQAASRGELLTAPPTEAAVVPAPALTEDPALWLRATPIALPELAAPAEGTPDTLASADDGYPPADPSSPAEGSVADELAAILGSDDTAADGADNAGTDPGTFDPGPAETEIADVGALDPEMAAAAETAAAETGETETETAAAEPAETEMETAAAAGAETGDAEVMAEEEAVADLTEPEPEPLRQWPVAPERHRSLRETLAEWAALAEWQLDWRAGARDWRPTAAADFAAATLPEAVAALFSTPELGGRLRADAYPLNRWLVVREAGP